MTPRDLLASLVSDPDNDCVLVLKPRDGFRAWVPKAVRVPLSLGEVSLPIIRVLVAQHYLARNTADFPEMFGLSAKAVERLLTGDNKAPRIRKSVTLKTSFSLMKQKLQVNPRTDAILVLSDDTNHVYVPDEAAANLGSGDAEPHLVLAMALYEILQDSVGYSSYWRSALETEVPGLIEASNFDEVIRRAAESEILDRHQG
jgi:hypothetical protein